MSLTLDRSDRRSGTLLYEQIEGHFARAIRRGEISPNEALPGTMVLAKELKISHLTVRKAYERLEQQGLVSRVQGKGTIVSDAGRPVFGMIGWLDDSLSGYQGSAIASAILVSLAQAIEAGGGAHRTLMLTTPRQDIYDGRWNEHDERILKEADLGGFYFLMTDLPGWFVHRCREEKIPLVGINGLGQQGDAAVRFSTDGVLQLAGEYLRQCGRSRPAVIFLDTVPGENRAHAHKVGETLRDAGAFDGTVQVIGVRQPTAFSGRAAMRQLLETPGSIDSVVCLDDIINQGVCAACTEAGIRVPDELLLISHANKGVTPPFFVPVARISCDYNHAVSAAQSLMSRLMNNENVGQKLHNIPPTLVREHVIEQTRVDLYGELV